MATFLPVGLRGGLALKEVLSLHFLFKKKEQTHLWSVPHVAY